MGQPPESSCVQRRRFHLGDCRVVRTSPDRSLPLPAPLSPKLTNYKKMAYSTSAGSRSGEKGLGVREGVLLGMGNPLLDITVYCDESFLQKYGLQPNDAILATTDEQHELFHDLVDMNPVYLAGGATQNSIRVAQWLLGVPRATVFFGGVGDDSFRHILERKAREVGVDVRYQVHPELRTGKCAAIITGEDRSLVTELGAAQLFTEDYLHKEDNWGLVERAEFFYVGGFIVPVSPDAVLSVARHCSNNGKTLIMNLHAKFVVEHFADPSLDIMQYVDILFGNGDEAAEFSHQAGFKTDDIKQIALLTASLPKANKSRPRLVVFTQGKQPTVIACNGEVREILVQPIDHNLIKDTNGCGDSFVGGFLSQLVKGGTVEDCLRCGTYAAKVVIQNYGCTFPEKPDFS